MVSRLLGHSSTDITEKVYARFLPVIAKRFRQKETLSAELGTLKSDLAAYLPDKI